jgi:hypothetical protein
VKFQSFIVVKLPSLSLLLAIFGVATACQYAFGDFELGDGGAESGSDASLTLCVRGEFRCSDAWLYACNATEDGWTQAAVCASAERCDSSRGRCLVCVPGEHRCSGGTLEVCNADRTGWDVVAQCGSADRCNLNSASCRDCVAGEFQCNGTELQQCTAQLTWQLVQSCETAALCRVGTDRLSGFCAARVCGPPGQHHCEGTTLLRCPPGMHRWRQVDSCATAALCDATAADAQAASGQLGSCQPQVCQPDEVRCLGAGLDQLSRCNQERTDWQTIQSCENRNQCSPQQVQCAPCSPGEYQCNGPDLRRCTAQQTWAFVETCRTTALCNAAAGACDPPLCEPVGRVECNPNDPLVLRRCAATQNMWERLDVCATGALCNARDHKCDPPVCEAGRPRCVGKEYQVCAADRAGWETVEVCPEGQECDLAQRCSTAPCAAAQVRCNDGYLETCAAGLWSRKDRCATPALCSVEAGGRCLAPVCGEELGDFRCLGASLQRCSINRDNWEDYDTCRSEADCDAAAGRCLAR